MNWRSGSQERDLLHGAGVGNNVLFFETLFFKGLRLRAGPPQLSGGSSYPVFGLLDLQGASRHQTNHDERIFIEVLLVERML